MAEVVELSQLQFELLPCPQVNKINMVNILVSF